MTPPTGPLSWGFVPAPAASERNPATECEDSDSRLSLSAAYH